MEKSNLIKRQSNKQSLIILTIISIVLILFFLNFSNQSNTFGKFASIESRLYANEWLPCSRETTKGNCEKNGGENIKRCKWVPPVVGGCGPTDNNQVAKDLGLKPGQVTNVKFKSSSDPNVSVGPEPFKWTGDVLGGACKAYDGDQGACLGEEACEYTGTGHCRAKLRYCNSINSGNCTRPKYRISSIKIDGKDTSKYVGKLISACKVKAEKKGSCIDNQPTKCEDIKLQNNCNANSNVKGGCSWISINNGVDYIIANGRCVSPSACQSYYKEYVISANNLCKQHNDDNDNGAKCIAESPFKLDQTAKCQFKASTSTTTEECIFDFPDSKINERCGIQNNTDDPACYRILDVAECLNYNGGQACGWCSGSPVGRPGDVNSCHPYSRCLLRCLSYKTNISTPSGEKIVTSIKIGDLVYSVNKLGERVLAKVIKTQRIPVKNHFMTHLEFENGKTVEISGTHPMANGKLARDLKVGDLYDGSVITKSESVPYDGDATYDLLVDSEMGFYYANGVLMDSTMH